MTLLPFDLALITNCNIYLKNYYFLCRRIIYYAIKCVCIRFSFHLSMHIFQTFTLISSINLNNFTHLIMETENYVGTTDYHEYLDKKVIVLLWDGKYLNGRLRSFDQFNSIALENVVEMMFYDRYYTNEKHKVYVVRGENVVMIGLGDFSLEKYEYLPIKAYKALVANTNQ